MTDTENHHAAALAAVPLLLLLAASLPGCHAALPVPVQVAEEFADHCLGLGPKKCAEFTVNVLTEVSGGGGASCAVSPKQAAVFKPLSRSLAAWEAFYRATMLDKRCIADTACTEKAYNGVGASAKGHGTVRVLCADGSLGI